jgi:NAD(P)-dependent dehydrogenase (short-subunit alcohol dehydrogenase family)
VIPKLFEMKEKTTLITGAAGFLGIKHAYALAELNSALILTDINEDKLFDVKRQVSTKFPKIEILTFIMDVSSTEAIEKISNHLKDISVKVDVLINNAAINPIESELSFHSRIEHLSIAKLQNEINVGLIGALQCSRIFGQSMAENKQGSIINIASDLSVISPNQTLYKIDGIEESKQNVKPVSYSIIKTGLIGLTRYLATYWATSNVRVNAISPGGVFNNHDNEFERKISELIPMGRMCLDWELTGAVQFLASNASSYMTGQNLVIDGGRSIW